MHDWTRGMLWACAVGGLLLAGCGSDTVSSAPGEDATDAADTDGADGASDATEDAADDAAQDAPVADVIDIVDDEDDWLDARLDASDTRGDAEDTANDTRPEDGSGPDDDAVDASPDAEISNECGGDEVLVDEAGEPAAPLDPCGCDGVFVCDGTDALRCDDVNANACGGCGVLGAVPGSECEPCATWRCNAARDGVTCVPDNSLPGCGPPVLVRCEELDCASLLRVCVEATFSSGAFCGDCLMGAEAVGDSCEAALAPPTEVSATLGTSVEQVVVSWAAVAGADGYHVVRDGVRVTGAPVTGLAWTDTAAPAPPAPNAPNGVAATVDRPLDVSVTWLAATSRTGAPALYSVQTVAGARESLPSAQVTGYRAASPVTSYEVQVEGGAWEAVGAGLQWFDEAAPAGSIASESATASTNFPDRVDLSVALPGLNPGAMRTYRVRARNAAGAGTQSDRVEGRRRPGTRSFQWQWASAITGPWNDLAGATARLASDTSIAPGISRWYRVQMSAEGAPTRVAGPVQGTRFGGALTLGDACTSNATCGGGNWCPTDTAERRCSPRPEVGTALFPFQWVSSGAFTMGSPAAETGRRADNESQVAVTISRNLFVMRTEVTQGQWREVMTAWNALPDADRTLSGWTGPTPPFATEPAWFGPASTGACGGNDCPVERVNWWDAVVFANVLSRLEGRTPCYTLTGCGTGTGPAAVGGGCGITNDWCNFTDGTFSCTGATFTGVACTGYRLPTEAEWEFAARGGTTTATWRGNLSNLVNTCSNPPAQANLDPIARWCGNSFGASRAAAGLGANPWGLYDTLGNVAEWTWNLYADAHTSGTNPVGPSTGTQRAVRNGSWQNPADVQRAASRYALDPRSRFSTVGFRLVRTGPV